MYMEKLQRMIYAIGDIHGCCQPLQKLLRKLEEIIREEDTLIFMGDYIDRGPQSKQVVELVMEWQKKHKKTVTLRGNHEQMLLDVAQKEREPNLRAILAEYDYWSMNGGHETMISYNAHAICGNFYEHGDPEQELRLIPEDHLKFFENTQMDYTEGCYYFVHAGPTNKAWERHNAGYDSRLWVREEFLEGPPLHDKVVVFGHTPSLYLYKNDPEKYTKPIILPGKIGIDTGMVFGGKLTMAILNPNAKGENRMKFSYIQAEEDPTDAKRPWMLSVREE